MKPVHILLNGVAFGLIVGFVTTPLASFAGATAVPVPEPSTLGLAVMASAGAVVAYRLFRHK